MKNHLLTVTMLLLSISAFSLDPAREYNSRLTPVIQKEKLSAARNLYDIMPEFSRYLVLPFDEHVRLDWHQQISYPIKSFYPQVNIEHLIDLLLVDVSASCDGKFLSARSTGESLSREQMDLINRADLGSDIHVWIRFRNKEQSKQYPGKSIDGYYTVTVIPAREAVYPGGLAWLNQYFKENVIDKMPESSRSNPNRQATVKFTVNEEGKIEDAKILTNSTDPLIDKLLQEATSKLTQWQPAVNSKGVRVKQVFTLGYGQGC